MGWKLAELYVQLTANDSKFNAAVKRAHLTTVSLSTAMDRAAATAKRMLLAGAAATGLLAKAAIEGEQAHSQLSAALRATGQYSSEMIGRLSEAAMEIQRQTLVSDDAAKSMMAFGVGLGVSSSHVVDLTKAAIGLSRILRMDVQQAMRVAVMAEGGQFRALQRMVPEIKNAESASEALVVVQQLANQGWRQSRNEINTTYGAIVRLKNMADKLAEAIGTALLPTIKRWSQYGTALAQELREMSDRDIDKLIGRVKTLGIVLVGVWAAPSLIAGIRGVSMALGLVRAALISCSVAASTATMATAGLAAGFALLTMGIASAWMEAEKYRLKMIEIGAQSRTDAQLQRDIAAASKRATQAGTPEERLAALNEKAAYQRQMAENIRRSADQEETDRGLDWWVRGNLGSLGESAGPQAEKRGGYAAVQKLEGEAKTRQQNALQMANRWDQMANDTEMMANGLKRAGVTPGAGTEIKMRLSPGAQLAEENKAKANPFTAVSDLWKQLSSTDETAKKQLDVEEQQLGELKLIRTSLSGGGGGQPGFGVAP